jgi:two-component system chemotaxis response regulator CheB
MGHDGLHGAEILRARGASILAQDEASSVVWGMPGAVVNAGIADRVLPLDQIVPEILRRADRN